MYSVLFLVQRFATGPSGDLCSLLMTYIVLLLSGNILDFPFSVSSLKRRRYDNGNFRISRKFFVLSFDVV